MSIRDEIAPTNEDTAAEDRSGFDALGGLMSRVPLRNGGEEEAPFDIARRGYNKAQVEHHLAELDEALNAERRRAAAAEEELRNAQARMGERDQQVETGFGSRVEKLLQLAEQEAAEIREKASEKATGLLERARAEAETHRHQVEEDLIARTTKLDQEAARREATLNEREQEMDEKLAGANTEAQRIRSAAERDGEQERAKAQRRAQELTDQAERAAQATREAAEEEVTRLANIRDSVRAEMAELHRLLGTELETASAADGDGGTGGNTEDTPADE